MSSGKRKIKYYAQAKRCSYCGQGIIWVWRPTQPRKIPIEADSWEGSAYYIKGVHKFHQRGCDYWRNMIKKPEVVISETSV